MNELFPLLEKIKSLNLKFAPDSILVDFEPAIHAAIKKMFPHIPVFDCRFHLGQSCWRKIQGLSTEYRKFDSSISIFLRSLFGLPFLPPNAVSDSFVFDFVSIKPDDSRVTKFCEYLLDTYISESALFPPSIWAEYIHLVYPIPKTIAKAVKAVQTEIYIKMRSTLPKSKITLEREQFLNDKMMLWKSRNIDRHQFVCQVSSKF
ncbi:MULE domain-containing protein [Aphis craccivora]|uniref:MULE domain-containing protein n=1 Tax=Aphis craccivora TaxID=307492 RepID=A0A6G0Y5Q7_APHCR|nr:MULE domain-containing protein [Aphis craccivora]